MGLLFAKLWSLFCNQEHKVIVVGLDNAGKTTILYQFLMNEVVHTSPTIGSNVEEIVVKNTHFLMWDIGGQESLRSSWNTYYSNTEFIILVVDSIDRERLSITREELYRMLAHEDLRKAAVLIFANKQDMKGCMSAAEISKSLTLSSIKDHPWHIQSCCALTGEGQTGPALKIRVVSVVKEAADGEGKKSWLFAYVFTQRERTPFALELFIFSQAGFGLFAIMVQYCEIFTCLLSTVLFLSQ
ncbi:ADP-ribosylation factor-like protein 5B isoform X1 [Ornithorhynchus anatinus]|uniref:ARF like GTPase 5B n=3 Tax=Ornithorhynchus anatinus TaxID=9258 RepID=A0A6I8NVB2_ORNAN|nr:ADP-ribosylation factor-like protein 5B isoform X1 [Ornithorhynchus anatinus]